MTDGIGQAEFPRVPYCVEHDVWHIGTCQQWEAPVSKPLISAEAIAKEFHEAYERLAPNHGYETREASAKPWADVPANNRALMTATVADLIANGVIIILPGPSS